jgi:UDP-galactose transporter B1
MMCALNILSTLLTTVFLLFEPFLARSGVGAYLGMSPTTNGELWSAIDFIRAHPRVGLDVLAFAVCGALGQVFICE